MAPVKRIVAHHWFVRVDGEESFLRSKCRELSMWPDLVHCHGVYHAGAKAKENPHTHIILTLTESLQKQSFDIRIKKLFETKERNDYSTKEWDGLTDQPGCGSYLYHEGDDSPVLCNKGFNDVQIAEFKKQNESIQKVVKKNKERANTKLVDFALSEFADRQWSSSDEFKYEIFYYMLKRCKEGLNYYPKSDFMLKSFVEEVHLKLCPEINFEGFAQRKFNSLFRL